MEKKWKFNERFEEIIEGINKDIHFYENLKDDYDFFVKLENSFCIKCEGLNYFS